ncbi:hypothetical protein [Crenothrix sp.]|uniref:hypothetical protein n=1 Tax=Crenothrix sp. TaxID=3100433 RepID=UPI00374DF896
MNTSSLITRLKCAVVLILFAILGLGPFPVTSLLGVYVVIFRPQWFKNLVARIYTNE